MHESVRSLPNSIGNALLGGACGAKPPVSRQPRSAPGSELCWPGCEGSCAGDMIVAVDGKEAVPESCAAAFGCKKKKQVRTIVEFPVDFRIF